MLEKFTLSDGKAFQTLAALSVIKWTKLSGYRFVYRAWNCVLL